MPIKKKLFNAPVVLSFGSGAGKIISKIETPLNVYKIAINSSDRDLQMIDTRVDETVLCGSGIGSGMSPIQGREDLYNGLRKVFRMIDDACYEAKATTVDIIPMISSLGHGFGSGSLTSAIGELQRRYKNAIILPFVITPFTWEGTEVVKRAYESLKEATDVSPCFVISNEEVGSVYKDIGASYESINSLIGDSISVILRSFSATEGVLQTIDRNDFSKFFIRDIATIRHMRIKSAKDLTFDDIKENIGKRWLKIDAKMFKPISKLNVTYILDGKGPFSPKVLQELQENATKKDYINKEYIKPLLIERKKVRYCDFVWMESGFKLKCDKNIYGEY